MFLLLTSAQFGGHSEVLLQRHVYIKSSLFMLYSTSSRKAKTDEEKSYYEVLGLSEKCSAVEIKHAYYRLSKLYHPDVNDTELAHTRFQIITEAYEVIGNVHKRRLYDKGIYNPLHGHNIVHPSREKKISPEAFTQRKYSPRRPPPTGRSNVYNFDEFYRQHYGRTLRRDQELIYSIKKIREQQAEYERQMPVQEEKEHSEGSPVYYAAGIVFGGLAFVCWWLFN